MGLLVPSTGLLGLLMQGRISAAWETLLKVDVYHLPSEVPEGALRGKTTIVIDVLRASSTITTALQNGCKDIIPTSDIEAASTLVQQLGRKSVLLCGERNGKKIDGFDLGNSPSEFSAATVRGQSLVMATTNGSRAIVRAKPSALCLIACFLNASSACRYALKSDADIAIMCAGKEGTFSLEDTVCSGLILSLLTQQGQSLAVEPNDAAQAARVLYNHYADDILGMMQNSSHGRYLTALGFGDDLVACAQTDTLETVPMFSEGRMAKAQDKANRSKKS